MPAPNPSSRPRRRHDAINAAAASRIATVMLTARSAGSGMGTGSLKNTMIPSPENWSSVPSNCSTSGPRAPWYRRRKSSTSLGLGRLGESGVAAQVAEHDDDLAAMAFEDLLVALRDDELGQLRREKPLQSPDPPQFLDLLGHPRLETAVEFRHFFGPLTQFAKQPRVLHRDDRLRREFCNSAICLSVKGRTSRRPATIHPR